MAMEALKNYLAMSLLHILSTVKNKEVTCKGKVKKKKAHDTLHHHTRTVRNYS
jgi:hypothetical protein